MTATNPFCKPFWMDPQGVAITVDSHHYVEARLWVGHLPANDANEKLLQLGWLRCNIFGSDLFYERRKRLSASQLRELKNIAIEKSLTVFDDNGKQL